MRRSLLLFILALTTWATAIQAQPMRLWYNKPATAFEESLPIGNGKLGALIYGGADNDTICLNDITLWTGQPVDLHEGRDAHRWIPVIRQELFKGNYKNADILQHLVQGHNSAYYQPLAIVNMIDHHKGTVSNYRRELSLDNALATLNYQRNNVQYTREYFASHPDKVVAIRMTANQPHAIDQEITITSLIPHRVKVSDGQLTMTGHAMGDEQNSIHFCSILQVRQQGGIMSKTDSSVMVKGANEIIIYLVNETSYNGFDKHPVNEGAPYIEQATDDAWHLTNYSYEQLRERHLTDYRQFFNRVSFSLKGAREDLHRTTEQQLLDYTNKKEQNPYLEMLYFQYGRYLLISSSRTPGLPANLQGLWAPQKKSPWRGNYTININLEENYWPAEVANLSELVMPVNGLVEAMAVTGEQTAQHYYGINKGWCAGHNSDAWAMTNPVGTGNESPKWSNWNMGGAWLVQTLWDHYDYNRDINYLRDTAYPLMKGAADFMLEWLIDNPKKPGELITAPCTSPEAEYITENGYKGCTFYGGTSDIVIIRELFQNTLKAASILHVDNDYQQRLHTALEKLAPYQVGKKGNLQEWYYDWEDQEPHHRHQSHLIGVYPFHQISVSKTPELAQAAMKTLELRGDYSTGWSTGWRISLWARLHRADKSYQMLRKLLTYVKPADYTNPKNRPKTGGGAYPNLFDAHPPFQIDGNFGGTAGYCEMLLQCDGTTMELLPALPDSWKTGHIKGLKARGGYTVDITWKNHQVTSACIHATQDGTITVKWNGRKKTITLKAKQNKTI